MLDIVQSIVAKISLKLLLGIFFALGVDFWFERGSLLRPHCCLFVLEV
jgi:hypothetical protein